MRTVLTIIRPLEAESTDASKNADEIYEDNGAEHPIHDSCIMDAAQDRLEYLCEFLRDAYPKGTSRDQRRWDGTTNNGKDSWSGSCRSDGRDASVPENIQTLLERTEIGTVRCALYEPCSVVARSGGQR